MRTPHICSLESKPNCTSQQQNDELLKISETVYTDLQRYKKTFCTVLREFIERWDRVTGERWLLDCRVSV